MSALFLLLLKMPSMSCAVTTPIKVPKASTVRRNTSWMQSTITAANATAPPMFVRTTVLSPLNLSPCLLFFAPLPGASFEGVPPFPSTKLSTC